MGQFASAVWVSLFPVATGWMGENHFAPVPSAMYGVVLFMASMAYWILQRTIIRSQGKDSLLGRAIGKDYKGRSSPLFYALAVPAAFLSPWASGFLFVFAALMWLVPDRRIEGVGLRR